MSIAFSFDQFVVTTLQVYHNYVKQKHTLKYSLRFIFSWFFLN